MGNSTAREWSAIRQVGERGCSTPKQRGSGSHFKFPQSRPGQTPQLTCTASMKSRSLGHSWSRPT